MDIPQTNGYTLRNLDAVSIVLGKNGCGKSRMLREVERGLSHQPEKYGKVKYITPERGGTLVYEAGTDQRITTDINWLSQERRKNQSTNFKQQSVAQYRKLETLVLREIEKERRADFVYTFDVYVGKINSLLDNIEIRREDTSFKLYRKGTKEALQSDVISSGESELVSLGIECLIFSKECVSQKENILLLDEPDVHLHPDLQVRLMYFLQGLISENNFKVLIATHSTAILGALESLSTAHLSFMVFGQTEVDFKPISEVYRKVLPVFGAHPLSNVFNQAPILLVEGEDDERIWQQAVRSSSGKIRLYPCAVGSVSSMNEFEVEAQVIIKTVYDQARGYSLRDRDEVTEEINDLPPIIRMKLSCRNAENLILSDEVLSTLGTSWTKVQEKIGGWIETNKQHPHFAVMETFRRGGYDRKNFNIKEIRNDLMGIIGSSKPWEVVVGGVIAALEWDEQSDFQLEDKILSYMGEKTVRNLIPKRQ